MFMRNGLTMNLTPFTRELLQKRKSSALGGKPNAACKRENHLPPRKKLGPLAVSRDAERSGSFRHEETSSVAAQCAIAGPARTAAMLKTPQRAPLAGVNTPRRRRPLATSVNFSPQPLRHQSPHQLERAAGAAGRNAAPLRAPSLRRRKSVEVGVTPRPFWPGHLHRCVRAGGRGGVAPDFAASLAGDSPALDTACWETEAVASLLWKTRCAGSALQEELAHDVCLPPPCGNIGSPLLRHAGSSSGHWSLAGRARRRRGGG